MKFVMQAFGVIVAVAIVATGIYIDHQQQDVLIYQRESQLGKTSQKGPDPAVAFFGEIQDPLVQTDIVDASNSFDPEGINGYLDILANASHHRLIMYVDSSEGNGFSGKIDTLEKLALENKTSMLAVNYQADGSSDVEFFAAPDVTMSFTDQEAAAFIRDKVKPALAENRPEYGLIQFVQQFSQQVYGHILIGDSRVDSDFSHIISKPGGAASNAQDSYNLFDEFAAEAQHNTTNGIAFLIVLCVLALLLIWRTPSRYWGFIYGGAIAFAGYQALQLPTSDKIDMAKPHTLFIPVIVVIIAGAAVGFFVDYLISRPANQAK